MNMLLQPGLQVQATESVTSVETGDQPHREQTLAYHAEEIRKLGKRVVRDVIEIGRRLSEAKKIVGHGNWLSWLDREFGWTDSTALNLMQVYAMVGKSGNIPDLNLPISGLYLLAAPSTPEEVRTEIIARAESGEVLSVADIQNSVEAVKEANAAVKAAADRAELTSKPDAVTTINDKPDKPPGKPKDLRRSRSARKTKPKEQRALSEFKHFVKIWFPRMDDDVKRKAVEYVIAYCKTVQPEESQS